MIETRQQPLIESGPSKRPRSPSRRHANDLDGATWTRYSISLWSDIRKTPEEYALRHPAMFPVELPLRLLKCFTTKDERLVLDPFAGIGSTVLAAEALGKIGIGLDISEDFISKARSRPSVQRELSVNGSPLGERRLYVADANDLLSFVEPGTVDMVITSPPYWDILLQERTADSKEIRHYGDSERDLGRIRDYNEFLFALGRIFARTLTVLKPGGYCCVVVMDLRKKNVFYPYHSDVANQMQQIGFKFDDIIIWDRRHEYNNLRPLGHPSVFRVNKTHEYILIFQKPKARGSLAR
jgi:DNA modification methylase